MKGYPMKAASCSTTGAWVANLRLPPGTPSWEYQIATGVRGHYCVCTPNQLLGPL
eukprot:COSAG05_NODE_74_length_21769_cov_194.316290_24_plen_55_part_00